jgi:hypothetical protein
MTYRNPPAGMVVAALALVGLAHAAELREPIELIPADSLLCWYGRPMPDTTPATQAPSTLQTLVEVGARLAAGPLEGGPQLNLRMAEMLGLMLHYPHAVALLDARAKPTTSDPTGRKVDRLRFALVVQVGDQVAEGDSLRRAEPFLRIIQKAVNEQTNSGAATLVSEKIGRWTYQELRDQRLPDWAAIAWGTLDGYFVLTVGPNVWRTIATVAAGDEPSLAGEPWYAVARAKRRKTALAEIFVAAHEIQQRLDPFVDGRASEFFRAWDAGDLTQAHWALGFEQHAMFCVAHFRRQTPGGREEDTTVRRIYADAGNRDPHLLAAVPPDARYAIFDVQAGPLLVHLARALLTLQGAKSRANIERLWDEAQAQHGFDVEHGLLAHLGSRILLHNDPPHPLHLPLALTVLLEIRDQPATVRQTVEAMCAAWQAMLDDVAAKGGAPPPFTLHRDDDGIWYMRFGVGEGDWLGLAGPAWIVTDRYIILSWSPMALREYLDKVPDEVTRRTTSRPS